MSNTGAATVIPGLDNGRWVSSALETEGKDKNNLGMIYRTSASISEKLSCSEMN